MRSKRTVSFNSALSSDIFGISQVSDAFSLGVELRLQLHDYLSMCDLLVDIRHLRVNIQG